MTIEVLIATMGQEDHQLLKKMKVESDAIVGNQCDRNQIEDFKYKKHNIKYLSFKEKGVGLNRNNALMRSKADICLLADDDMVLRDNYVDILTDSFRNNPNTDIIIFDLIEKNRKRYGIKKKYKIGYFNYMKFGAAGIAFRKRKITKNGISFNLHFGGGAEYSAGEDTLFLNSCLKSRLNIIALPLSIATLKNDRESTWFEGYTDKYFKDKGAIFYAVSPIWAKLLCLQFSLRRRKIFKENKKWYEALKLMLEGLNEFKG